MVCTVQSRSNFLQRVRTFFFTYDYVKASTLYWNIRRTRYDGCYCWNLQIIEESTQVSQMHCRHEIGHITNDLHAFMDLDWDYLQTKWA